MTTVPHGETSRGSGTDDRVIVAYSINKEFLLPCAVSLTSLVREFEKDDQSSQLELHVYVYHNDTISQDEFRALQACAKSAVRSVHIELRSFNYKIPALLCDAPWWNNIETVATLILPEVLTGLKRAIFLDADTLILGGIADLWRTDLQGRPYGCVPDGPPGAAGSRTPNTGVIVYDIEEWNRRELTSKALHYVTTYRTFHVDQEPLAAISEAEFTVLPLKWNYAGIDTWMYAAYGQNLPTPDIRVAHFNGPPRPWFACCPRKYSAEWYRHFLDTPFSSQTLPRLERGHFIAFRISRWERGCAKLAARHKLFLLPHSMLKKLRMSYQYNKYRLVCWRSSN